MRTNRSRNESSWERKFKERKFHGLNGLGSKKSIAQALNVQDGAFRLELGVWVSASFQIFALTDRRNVLAGDENCPGGENVWGNMSEGERSRGEMSCTPKRS